MLGIEPIASWWTSTLTTELHVQPPIPSSTVGEYLLVTHSLSPSPTRLTPSVGHVDSWPVSGSALLSLWTLDHSEHPGRVGGKGLWHGPHSWRLSGRKVSARLSRLTDRPGTPPPLACLKTDLQSLSLVPHRV